MRAEGEAVLEGWDHPKQVLGRQRELHKEVLRQEGHEKCIGERVEVDEVDQLVVGTYLGSSVFQDFNDIHDLLNLECVLEVNLQNL